MAAPFHCLDGDVQRRWLVGRLMLAMLLAAMALLAPKHAMAATVYGQGSGLPNLSVRAFALDPEGYVWLGTEDGVFRFDGHRFEPLDLSSPGSPQDNYVSTMVATPAALYVATRTGLHRHDWRSGRRQVLRDQAGGELGGIFVLQFMGEGHAKPMLAGMGSGHLLHFADQADAVPMPAGTGEAEARPEAGWITDIHAAPEQVWLATTKGVFAWGADPDKRPPGANAFTPLRFKQPALDDGARYARAVLEHPHGVLWVGYWNDGLVRLNLATGEHRWFHPAQPDAGALRATSIYALLPRGERTLIATNRGLVYHEPACDCLRSLNHPEWDKSDGNGVIIQAIMRQGDAVWAAPMGGGAYRIAPEDWVFEHQVKADGRSDSLALPIIRALHVGANRRLWIGTYGGVQWIDADKREQGQMWPLQTLPWSLTRTESRFLWSIEEDPNQDLWLGTGTGFYRHSAGKLIAMTPAVESGRCSLLTSRGRRYLGSVFGLFRVENDVLVRVPLHNGGTAADAASDVPVWSLTEFDGELWVGTSAGLYRLDEDEQLIAHHGIGIGPSDLPGAQVLQQRRTPDGRVWQVTSGGLVEVLGNAQRREFAPQPALLAAQVRSPVSIEVDAKGVIWLGTVRGLVRFDPVRSSVEIFGHSDGLVSEQLMLNASATDGERLFFGTFAGLISVNPEQLPERQPELAPRVTKFRLGQAGWRRNPGELQLAHDHAPLQLELSALHYRWPERVRYAYRWSDHESDFTELGDARSATFSNLPRGTRVLELRAELEGPFKAQATTQVLTVHVTPAWHEAWWARALLLGGVLLGIYAFVAWRSRAARSQKQELEALVAQRTFELRLAKEAMEAANDQLQELASNDPLTSLANRRKLLEEGSAQREVGQSLSVVMLDIDHFKQINDRYGHEAGDIVLQQFAQILRRHAEQYSASTGGQMLAARYGGEEFTCLFSDVQTPAVEASAVQLLAEIANHHFVIDSQTSLRLTASLGCAEGGAGDSLQSLIRRADAALYRVKAAGRAHWQMG
ncbi:MAG: GGDEF domain-containing protein [Pseudomarimonas sp.]